MFLIFVLTKRCPEVKLSYFTDSAELNWILNKFSIYCGRKNLSMCIQYNIVLFHYNILYFWYIMYLRCIPTLQYTCNTCTAIHLKDCFFYNLLFFLFQNYIFNHYKNNCLHWYILSFIVNLTPLEPLCLNIFEYGFDFSEIFTCLRRLFFEVKGRNFKIFKKSSSKHTIQASIRKTFLAC